MIDPEEFRAAVREIEGHEDAIRETREEMSEVFTRLGKAGVSKRALKLVLGRRRMDAAKREEVDALVSLYEGLLGDGVGPALSDAALRRLAGPEELGAVVTFPGAEDSVIENARGEGAAAVDAGKAITSNPYTAKDPRRAAWEAGWMERALAERPEVAKALGESVSSDGDGEAPTPAETADANKAARGAGGKKAARAEAGGGR